MGKSYAMDLIDSDGERREYTISLGGLTQKIGDDIFYACASGDKKHHGRVAMKTGNRGERVAQPFQGENNITYHVIGSPKSTRDRGLVDAGVRGGESNPTHKVNHPLDTAQEGGDDAVVHIHAAITES